MEGSRVSRRLLGRGTCPGGERGPPPWRARPGGEKTGESARHSKHDADAYDAFEHDILKVLRIIKPLLDQVPPDIFSNDPEELIALAALGRRFRDLEPKVLHDAVRLLTGSAADFPDRSFGSDILKGWPGSA